MPRLIYHDPGHIIILFFLNVKVRDHESFDPENTETRQRPGGRRRMRRTAIRSAMALVALGFLGLAANAQDASEKEIERYRAMISDPMSNPGFLAVDRGEALWGE